MSAPAALPALPFPQETADALLRLTQGLEPAGLWWLSGYAAGLASRGGQEAPTGIVAPQAASGERLTIVYGSQTGNARRAAEALLDQAHAAGLAARLVRADAYPTRELASERLLYVVISTQGEGDPPDDAIGFVEFLQGRRAPKLPELRYAVLGLGDTSYADFCGIARRIDTRLAELGAQRVTEPALADLDIDTVATPWRDVALARAREHLQPTAAHQAHVATVTPLRPAASWSHERPFPAEVLASQGLSGREFRGTGFRRYGTVEKDVRHLELSLEGSGLAYEPGDALGIRHRNPEALVAPVLEAARLDGDARVELDGEALSLSEWLATRRELTRLSRPTLTALADRSGADELRRLLQPGDPGFAALLADHQLVDVLRRWPADWDAPSLLAALRPQAQRLYSIASSRKRVGEEAHLTLDVVAYHAHGHVHLGAASGFLSSLDEGAQVPVYIEPNERFRVPADPGRDIIMIGPGTGVAPFRGFVQERAETGASRKNWLFFGARHFNTGFLYQVEWQDALRRKELHRLDLAFSRDQDRKVYVHDRLRERGRDLYGWLEGGAHLYVCGAIAMGKDVHAALLGIIASQRGGDADAAAEYLGRLQAEGRYARDVY